MTQRLTRKEILSTATFCKTTLCEIAVLTPNARRFRKVHVPEMGYVRYIYDANGECIGHVYREMNRQTYLIKNELA